MATKMLSVMVKDLRAEAGHSLSPAQGVNQLETLKYLLARTQEELWTAFVWPEHVVRTHVTMTAGQYLYPYPIPTLSFDAIREVWAAGSFTDTSWTPVAYGFPSEDMILPDFSNSSRSDTIQYWQPEDAVSGGHFRVWPTPDTGNVRLRFIGQQSLAPFFEDSHSCTLDATTIVLFAAAELLARAKAEDAAVKMQKAQRHLTKMLGNKISAKMKVATLGGGVSVSYNRTNRNLLWQS